MLPSRWILVGLAIILFQLSAARGSAQDLRLQPSRDSVLAARPLAGPRVALGVGGALLVAAPVILAVGVLSTFSLSSCDDFFTDDVDAQCEREQRDRQRENDQVVSLVIGASVSTALIGAGLLAFGVTRVVQIRGARRRIARLEHAALKPSPRGAALTLRFSF